MLFCKDGSSWLDVIDDAGVLVRRRGVNLCKKGDHPQYLGDYDGLAYDPATETVWVIECKEFEKTESAFDYIVSAGRF